MGLLDRFKRPNPEEELERIKIKKTCDRLVSLQKTRKFIEVTVEKVMFQTLILEVNQKDQTIYIDELYASQKAPFIKKGDVFHLKHESKGQTYSFDCEVLKVSEKSAKGSYKLALPKSVKTTQRRNAFRVFINSKDNLQVLLQGAGIIPTTASVIDLSATGIRLRVGGNIEQQLSPNMQLDKCSLTISENKTIIFCFTVKNFLVKQRPYLHTTIGGTINDLEKKDLHRLTNIIAGKQRQMLRKTKALN